MILLHPLIAPGSMVAPSRTYVKKVPLQIHRKCGMGTPYAFRPDSYPQITHGGEKPDEHPQAGFATRASLSRWFASQEGHHGSVPDSHLGGRPPSRRCLSSW